MTEWESIETAPKDGTGILLYIKETYTGRSSHVRHFIIHAYFNHDDKWISLWDSENVEYKSDDFEVLPTHWMSLPEPPKLP